jgi:eukaryotic-like serine/threonine-protein kinase
VITRPLADDAPDHGDEPPAPLRIAGRYEIRGLVGMGGMGSVYRVHDRELDEVVALKFLRADALRDERALDRFRDEAKLARRVSHVNVARTFDIGEHDGQKYLTMEFVDGEPLSRVLEREGPLPLARFIDLARQICAGLAAAHAAGVVHQDLKPDNVLLERGGRVVISDFGIARELRAAGETGGSGTEGRSGAEGASAGSGGIIGTAAYMAPEQLEGGAIDARSDVYALGALLYEALTGAPAWGDAVRPHHEPPPDPGARRSDLPASVAAIVVRCMAARKEDRVGAAADVASALEAAFAGLQLVPETLRFDAMPLAARSFRVAPAPREHATTVAVLPFKNRGPRKDDFLASELTDELIDELSMTGGLRVRPRHLVDGRSADDLQAFARDLGVQVIVEGTLRRGTDEVRITARVIGVAEGLQIWARRFDRPAGDLAGANDEVARAVREALTTRVETGEVRPARGVDAIASELYLRARSELRRSWGGTGDIDLAVDLFRQGLARAPDDGGSLSGFAMARARRYNYKGGDAAELTAIRALAESAIAHAPHLGEPWQTLATLSYVCSEWPDAVRSLRRALHLAPGLLKAHETLAHIEVESGRIDEGLFRLETVMALDPTPSIGRWEAARAHALCGRWERAGELLEMPVEDETDRLWRLMMSTRFDLWRGEPREPRVSKEEAGTSPFLSMACNFGFVLRERTVPAWVEDDLRARIARTAPRSRVRPLFLQFRAELYAAAGEHDEALASVREAVAEELYDRAWLSRCPLLAPLRSDPSWPALAACVDARADAVLAVLDEPLSVSGKKRARMRSL